MRHQQHPLHAAFTFTTLAVVFLVSGAIGLTIGKDNWSLVSGTWSDGVVWWEILYGIAATLPAAYFWRRGLRQGPMYRQVPKGLPRTDPPVTL